MPHSAFSHGWAYSRWEVWGHHPGDSSQASKSPLNHAQIPWEELTLGMSPQVPDPLLC